jgi:hypothetical protein
MFFANGGSSAYILRAIGASSDVASKDFLDAADDVSVTITAKNPGTWGNEIAVMISNVTESIDVDGEYIYDITVYYGGVTSAYSVERFSGVSNTSTHPRFVETVLSNSGYVTATVGAGVQPVTTELDPPVNLSGGLDGDAVDEEAIAGAVEGFDVINSVLIMNAVGVTSSTYVNQVIAYAEGRQDVFVVVDPSGTDADDQIDINTGYSASSFAAVYYPQVVIPDPTSSVRGATKTVSPSGAVIGLYATTDSSRGVYKAPAGLNARLGGVVSVAKLTNADLDNMNAAASAVNAIRYIPGTGIVVMGARTLKNTYVDRYVPVRRSLMYLRKRLTELTQFAVFEPNEQRLWAQLEDEVSKELTRFWQEGGLRGEFSSDAFFVKCDEDTNTVASIDAGEVNIEVGVALQRPAEFVIIKIGQFEGGTVVTVA